MQYLAVEARCGAWIRGLGDGQLTELAPVAVTVDGRGATSETRFRGRRRRADLTGTISPRRRVGARGGPRGRSDALPAGTGVCARTRLTGGAAARGVLVERVGELDDAGTASEFTQLGHGSVRLGCCDRASDSGDRGRLAGDHGGGPALESRALLRGQCTGASAAPGRGLGVTHPRHLLCRGRTC